MEFFYFLLKNENEKNVQDTLENIFTDYGKSHLQNIKQVSFDKTQFEKLHFIFMSFAKEKDENFYQFTGFNFIESMDCPYYFTIPFKFGKFFGFKKIRNKIQRFKNEEYSYDYILETIYVKLPGGLIEEAKVHWIVEISHHFIYHIPTFNLTKFSQLMKYKLYLNISLETIKYLILPSIYQNLDSSISRTIVSTKTMEEKVLNTYFNIHGKETIINGELDLKYENEFILGPLPPFSILLNTSYSYEWIFSTAKESLILEKEDKFKDFLVLMPKRKEEDRIFQYVFQDDYPIILSGFTNIELENPLICIKGKFVNKKIYQGLKENSLLLGLDSLKNDNAIIHIDNQAILEYLSIKECLNFVKNVSTETIDLIKSNSLYHGKQGWRLEKYENKFHINDEVFWILENINFYNGKNSIDIPVLLCKNIYSTIPNSFRSLIMDEKLQFEFHNVESDLKVEINESTIPIVILSFKEFLNSFKIHHIHEFDIELQDLVDKNQFNSLEEARKQFLKPNKIIFNGKYKYSWPIYNFNSNSEYIQIGDFHEKLIKEKINVIEFNNQKFTKISILKGFIIKIGE